MAQQYEDEHSKDQILNEYLNTATYGTTDGRSAVGVQAAAEVFFDKDVEDLGPARVGDARRPARRRPPSTTPSRTRTTAIKRRNEVLDAMADQGYITPAKAEQVKETGPGLERGYKYETRAQPFFFDFVQNELIDEYGLKTVRQGGLKVYTTLNPTDQAAAEQAIANAPLDRRRRPGARLDRHQHRRDHRDGLLAVLRHEPVQPRRRRRAPAGLVVQAVRADDRRRPGHRPEHDDLSGAVDDHADAARTASPGRSAAAAAAR